MDNSFDINLLPKPFKEIPETTESDYGSFYEKPNRIINSGLLTDNIKGQRQRLKNNLIEHFDYETLYPIVWKHLYSWFSADI